MHIGDEARGAGTYAAEAARKLCDLCSPLCVLRAVFLRKRCENFATWKADKDPRFGAPETLKLILPPAAMWCVHLSLQVLLVILINN